jgi:hypothetical protein
LSAVGWAAYPPCAGQLVSTSDGWGIVTWVADGPNESGCRWATCTADEERDYGLERPNGVNDTFDVLLPSREQREAAGLNVWDALLAMPQATLGKMKGYKGQHVFVPLGPGIEHIGEIEHMAWFVTDCQPFGTFIRWIRDDWQLRGQPILADARQCIQRAEALTAWLALQAAPTSATQQADSAT